MREKYAGNPLLARALHNHGSRISTRGICAMQGYVQSENERFVESVLAEEERQLRGIMTSPSSTRRARTEAFMEYTFKAENWRLALGQSPEAITAWKESFYHEIVSEAMHARFERILARNPHRALTLARMARGEDASGDPKGGVSSEPEAPLNKGTDTDAASANGDQDDATQLAAMAAEYATILPAEQLHLMQHRAEAEHQKRLRLMEECTDTLYARVEASLLRAVDGGDLAPLRVIEGQLALLGKNDAAQNATAMRELMTQAQPHLAASRFAPLHTQQKGVRDFFARPGLPSAGNKAARDRTLALVQQGLAQRENTFLRDPAGYAEKHPLLSQEGMSIQDFCTREGISIEEHITHSLRLQEHIGQGLDVNPRILPQARAAEIKDRYDSQDDPRHKAKLLRQLTSENGSYATRLMAEAGLPPGVSAFAQVLPGLSISDSARLAQAAETTLESLKIPQARKEKIQQRTAESPLAQALLTVDGVLSAPGAPGAPGTPYASSAPGAADILRSLESFVALGGSLPDLERRVVLANTQSAKDMAADAVTALQAGIATLNSNTEPLPVPAATGQPPAGDASAKSDGKAFVKADGEVSAEVDEQTSAQDPGTPQRSSWQQQAHSFGVGTRGVVDGVMGAADFAASPARAVLNSVNGLLGGKPDYFKPLGNSVSDALALPKAENPWEEIAHAINKGGSDAICTVWAANALLTYKAATSASNIMHDFVNLFRTAPAAQVSSGAGAELAVLAAQKAGAGPMGTVAAAMTGAMAGGKVAPGGAATATALEKSAALSAASAETKAARTAEGAALGQTKAARGNTAITKKPDAFALKPENMAQAMEKSPYTKHAGQVLTLEAKELGWSQTRVSYRKKRELPGGQKIEYTYDDIKADLYNNGWPKGKSIDAVIMPPDGTLTSIDNSRLAAIHELGCVDKHGRPIKPEVRIRRPDEALSTQDAKRFADFQRSSFPKTWGDATRERLRKQRSKTSGQEYRIEQSPRITGRPE